MSFLSPPSTLTLRKHMILFVVWTVRTHSMMFLQAKNRSLLLVYFQPNFINKTLLDLFLVVPRESWDISVVIVLLTSLPHMKLVSRASRPGLLVGFLRILVIGSKPHRDFTLRYTSTPVVLDAQMSLTLSHISRSVPGCTTFLFLETCCNRASS